MTKMEARRARFKADLSRHLAAVLFGCLFAVGFAAPAYSQAKGGVIRLEETVIEGRVQKPNAFFVSTRQALVYELTELKKSFVEKIHEVIERGEI